MLSHLSAPAGPGEGESWTRLTAAIREALPVHELDGIWVFKPIRRDGQEFGTAILSRVDGDKRRIYTAAYTHTLKGKQRGAFETGFHEVGTGPLEALAELLAMVPRRSDEEEPDPVPVEQWFPPVEAAEASEVADETDEGDERDEEDQGDGSDAGDQGDEGGEGDAVEAEAQAEVEAAAELEVDEQEWDEVDEQETDQWDAMDGDPGEDDAPAG